MEENPDPECAGGLDHPLRDLHILGICRAAPAHGRGHERAPALYELRRGQTHAPCDQMLLNFHGASGVERQRRLTVVTLHILRLEIGPPPSTRMPQATTCCSC